MIDMDAVNREIEASRAELAASEKAVLSWPVRRRIWEVMLDLQDDEVSYRHRIELKMMCVRRYDKRIQGINLMSLGDYNSTKTELNKTSIGNKL